MCLWNRFFALQDEDQEQQLARIAQAMEEAEMEPSPIGGAAAIQERVQMMRDFYVPLMALRRTSDAASQAPMATPNPLQAWIQSRQAEQVERVASNQINLDVPRENGDYMYYAQ